MTNAVTHEAFRTATYQKAARANTPVACVFELTPACNLRCHFCYVALDPYRGPYLGTVQMYRALDRIAEAGVLWLTLTGGEIFSRRDFAEIYTYALRKGFLVTLFTNATLVSERIAALLREHPPYEVEASIYGADAEHYEAVTGIPGSFARFERGMGRLLEAGIRPLMKHPVTTLTVDHLPAIRQWCNDRGLRHKFTTEIENRHQGGQEPSVYRIEPRRANAVKDELHRLQTGRERSLPLPECVIPGGDASERLYQCSAGRAGFFVDALGNVSHCTWDREPSFPLLEMEWQDLHAAMLNWVNQPLPADAPCSGCTLRGGCTNCPARARLATGSAYLKDTYHCDTTHAAYGLPPARHPGYGMERRPLGACAR